MKRPGTSFGTFNFAPFKPTRQEQLRVVQQLKNKEFLINNGLDAGQGPSNPNARSIAVPSECIHMVLGKGGDTLKEIQYTSGAERVELSTVVTPGTNSRNVYVDGTYEAYMKVRGN